MPRRSLLDLVALPAEGIEPGFDGIPLLPGVHLRWAFRPDLGFPSGGFQIHRRVYQFSWGDIPTPPVVGEWEHVRTVLPPASLVMAGSSDDAIAKRIHESLRSARAPGTFEAYRARIPECIRLLRQLAGDGGRDGQPGFERRLVHEDGRSSPVSIRVLDALLLAAMDPYIARMLGLYWIDAGIPPGRRVDYRITGLWGATPYPEFRYSFERVPREQLATGDFMCDDVHVFTERSATLDETLALRLQGAPGLELRLTFPWPVEEVRLAISHSEAAPRWRAWGQDETLVSGALDLTGRVEAVEDGIRIRSDRPFQRLVLTDESDARLTSWTLRGFRHREKTAPIGRVEAVTTLNATPDKPDDPPPAPIGVAAVRVESRAAPPGLDANGQVPPTASRVEIRVDAAAGDSAYSPVRLHVARSERASLRPAPAIPLTDRPVHHFPRPRAAAFWRLDGRPEDHLNGSQRYVAVGDVQFVRTYSDYENRYRRHAFFQTIEKGGQIRGGYLQVERTGVLRGLGTHLHIELWVFPLAPRHGWQFATLVDNGWRQSFWFGLRWDGGRYRLRFWLNGQVFESSRLIDVERWSRIGVRYDGPAVRFYIDGGEAGEAVAELGPVKPEPLGRAPRIGASLEADADRMDSAAFPYWGGMMNLRIESGVYPQATSEAPALLAGWSLDRTLADIRTRAVATAVGSARYERGHPQDPDRYVLRFEAGQYVRAGDHPSFARELDRLFVQLWVRPEPGQSFPTLVGNGWQHSFWLGLDSAGSKGYRLRFWLNGALYHSNSTIPASRWSHVGVAYDGESVVFYIDESIDSIWAARLGPVAVNPTRVLALGASAYSAPGGSPLYPFRGEMADVYLWADVPGPPAPALLTGAGASGDESRPADFVDHAVPDGAYEYRVQGVDLFGRVGPTASVAAAVQDTLEPGPPVNVRAEFRPLTGRITGLNDTSIATDIVLPPSVTAADLIRHDLEVRSTAGGDAVRDESFTILHASEADGRLTLAVRPPPFPRLQPAVGDVVAVTCDLRLRVRWAWTGLQRLFTPRARAFRLYLHAGAFNRFRRPIAAVRRMGFRRFAVRTEPRVDAAAAGLIGLNGLAGPFLYTVEPPPSAEWDLQLRYNASPVQEPRVGALLQINIPESAPGHVEEGDRSAWERIGEVVALREAVVLADDRATTAEPVSAEEVSRLREVGVAWISGGPRLHVVELRGVKLPADLRDVDPAAYVPGALVAFDETDGRNEWEAFSVQWHEWDKVGVVRLYFSYRSATSSRPRLSRMRYYPGERYEQIIELPARPAFDAAQGTAEYAVALATIDDRGREGPLSDPAHAIAVDRRRPPDPPRPMIVAMDRPDYYGCSRAIVQWSDVGGGATYRLYRAADTAVFTRDLEQRRLRSGAYEGLAEDAVFGDDPDFVDWLTAVARRLGPDDLTTTWRTRLFVHRPAGPRPSAEPPADPEARRRWDAAVAAWAAWDAATPIWRAWAERFYPALTDAQLVDLAERPGNETAFTLLNESPISGSRYVDTVDGRVRNRYLYRLRTIAPSQLASAGWGPASEPGSSPSAQPPRAPVIARVEAGDGQITLHWALNREPGLAAYRIYRAASREELEDLRWWESRPDDRLIATVPDPRLKARGRAVTLPSGLDVADVLAVYRADEFAPDRAADDQPQALNYLPATVSLDKSGPLPIVRGLRPVADGVSLVVVYRDSRGTLQVAGEAGIATVQFTDEGLPAGQDFYYRVVAVDESGGVSEGSAIVQGRAVDLTPPDPPEWQRAEWVLLDEAGAEHPFDTSVPDGAAWRPAVALRWRPSEPVSSVVQRRAAGEARWQTVSSELPAGEYTCYDVAADPGRATYYRIKVRDSAGNVNLAYRESFVPPAR